MIHELKTWPEPFQAVFDGRKHHELRKDDRGFKVGDCLTLREWLPQESQYSGRVVEAEVTFITSGESWGLTNQMCVMSIVPRTKSSHQFTVSDARDHVYAVTFGTEVKADFAQHLKECPECQSRVAMIERTDKGLTANISRPRQ